MSDSDSDQDINTKQNGDFANQHVIKPAKGSSQLATSTWPLLKKEKKKKKSKKLKKEEL